mmetsp:Transcript_50213/g.162707  ORF Transcript_50213/g.162707 Transcript_50213/m.162707 type:complete len:289 (-) Transcript_50213:389-1255(-)
MRRGLADTCRGRDGGGRRARKCPRRLGDGALQLFYSLPREAGEVTVGGLDVHPPREVEGGCRVRPLAHPRRVPEARPQLQLPRVEKDRDAADRQRVDDGGTAERVAGRLEAKGGGGVGGAGGPQELGGRVASEGLWLGRVEAVGLDGHAPLRPVAGLQERLAPIPRHVVLVAEPVPSRHHRDSHPMRPPARLERGCARVADVRHLDRPVVSPAAAAPPRLGPQERALRYHPPQAWRREAARPERRAERGAEVDVAQLNHDECLPRTNLLPPLTPPARRRRDDADARFG